MPTRKPEPLFLLIAVGVVAILGRFFAVDWRFVFLSESVLIVAWLLRNVFGAPRTKQEDRRSFDGRPADGEVPIVRISGIESVPNEEDPRVRTFARFETGPPTCSPRPSRRVSPLLGRIGLFQLFVGRDGGRWSDREVVEAYRSLERMGRWIEREARRFDALVNLEIAEVYFRAEDAEEEDVAIVVSNDAYETVMDEADADLKGIAAAGRAAKALGSRDLNELIEKTSSLRDFDTTVWFVHLMRAGRSSAITADHVSFACAGLALCYAREAAFSERLVGIPFVDPTTLAHEMLHLFGATDKYGTSLKRFPPGTVTRNDIMRLDETRLNRVRIDPLTASEVGWPSRVKTPAVDTRSAAGGV